jgi:uncharacterized lipoprotein YddW (UPF0748 family)
MRRRLVALSTISLIAWLAAGARPDTADGPEVRAFWVDAFNPGIKSRAEIDQLIDRALAANANTLIAQIRRRGDSYYFDSLEPFVEDAAVAAGFDPLGYLIERAHANGLEVHAWVAANAVYSGNPAVATATWPCRVPCSPSHVFNQHGYFAPGDENWLTRTHPSFTAGTVAVTSGGVTIVPVGWRISDGNWWVDPGHPAAAEHMVQVFRHLVERYDVDGLHLDRIRYPEMPIARPAPGGPVGFSTGYNAVSVRRFNDVYGRPAGSLPNPWDSEWNDWRREQMNALVRRIYLETIAVKPHVKISASTITFFRGPTALGGFSRTEAYSRVYQDWDGWLHQGFLDLNIPMVYKVDAGDTQTQFNDWTDFTRTHQYDRQAAIGIGVYLNSFEASIAQLERSRSAAASGERAAGQALYSYATTNRSIGGVPERPYAQFFRALSEDGAYVAVAPYNATASIPPMPWKHQPREGYLLAQVVDPSGAPEDGAVVVIRKLGRGPRDVELQQYADGNGYVGGANLPPGAYQLEITTPTGTTYVTVPEPVTPGRVTRLRVNVGSAARGPMVRAARSMEPDTRADEEFSSVAAWRTREPRAEDVECEGPECR